MTTHSKQGFRLLMTGAGYRFIAAVFVILVLWGGYFWATSTPGAL